MSPQMWWLGSSSLRFWTFLKNHNRRKKDHEKSVYCVFPLSERCYHCTTNTLLPSLWVTLESSSGSDWEYATHWVIGTASCWHSPPLVTVLFCWASLTSSYEQKAEVMWVTSQDHLQNSSPVVLTQMPPVNGKCKHTYLQDLVQREWFFLQD